MSIQALLSLVPAIGVILLAGALVFGGYAMFSCLMARLHHRECPYS